MLLSVLVVGKSSPNTGSSGKVDGKKPQVLSQFCISATYPYAIPSDTGNRAISNSLLGVMHGVCPKSSTKAILYIVGNMLKVGISS